MPQDYLSRSRKSKSHVIAALLAVFLGMFGVHKFYLGYNQTGFVMLAVTVLGSLVTFGVALLVVEVISLIEAGIYLIKSQEAFEETYVLNKREWF